MCVCALEVGCFTTAHAQAAFTSSGSNFHFANVETVVERHSEVVVVQKSELLISMFSHRIGPPPSLSLSLSRRVWNRAIHSRIRWHFISKMPFGAQKWSNRWRWRCYRSPIQSVSFDERKILTKCRHRLRWPQDDQCANILILRTSHTELRR